MKIIASLVIVSVVPVVSAFSNGVIKPFKTTLFSSSNDYLGNLKPGAQAAGTNDEARVKEMGKALEQRLGDLSRMEKQLEQRLTDLAKSEETLQSRLQTVSGPKKTLEPLPTPSNIAANIDDIWQSSTITTVQGGSLRTWSFANPGVKRVHVLLKTDGRPLDADVELWQGPDNTPHKMKVYVEDGGARTFSTFIDTPRSPNTICIKNTGHLEFPLYGCVGVDKEAGESCLKTVQRNKGVIIQGGALRTYAFDPMVNSVAVMIKTDGRPLNARIELLQGPNNNKQVLALYTEDGLERPFLAIIQTPGSGNVVRVVNTAPVEFPMHATVVEHEIITEEAYSNDGIQIGQEW